MISSISQLTLFHLSSIDFSVKIMGNAEKFRKTELVTDHDKLMQQRATWTDLVKRLHDFVLKVSADLVKRLHDFLLKVKRG